MAKKPKDIGVSDILTVDPFTQRIYIDQSGNGRTYPLVENYKDFFDNIYMEKIHSIKINNIKKDEEELSKWLTENIWEANSCRLLIIHGYAGCGKTTWVQSLFYKKFGDDISYNTFNYNFGDGYNDNNEAMANKTISESIKVSLANSITDALKKGKRSAYQKLIDLTKQYDALTVFGPQFWECLQSFPDVDSITESAYYANLKEQNSNNENYFRKAIIDQLTDFGQYQLLCIDYLWRIAQFLDSSYSYDKREFFVCYDNLDSVPKNSELIEFRNNLQELIQHLSQYIDQFNVQHDIQIPHFVIFTTYRNITEIRTKDDNTETQDDQLNDNYLVDIDVSQIYNYNNIISKRIEHFSEKLKKSPVASNKDLIEQMQSAKELAQNDLSEIGFSNMFNYNYRTCNAMMEAIVKQGCIIIKKLSLERKALLEKKALLQFSSELDQTISLINHAIHSIITNKTCCVLKSYGIWGSSCLDLNNAQNSDNHTTLSRLMLTYIRNTDTVSSIDIYKTFNKVFYPDYIIRILSQLLKRQKGEVWRRPVYYSKHALSNDFNLQERIKEQYQNYLEGSDNLTEKYIELTISEAGKSFVDRTVPHFEFYSARMVENSQSLYCITDLSTLTETLEKVYYRLETCCDRHILFMNKYIEKYLGIVDEQNKTKYIELKFHPKTQSGNVQLHVERVFFAHVDYLNKYRVFILKHHKLIEGFSIDLLPKYNEKILEFIKKYLNLYDKKIKNISHTRSEIVEKLWLKYSDACRDDIYSNKITSISVSLSFHV